jgi:tetratricopeptide (TPR) repeat protein
MVPEARETAPLARETSGTGPIRGSGTAPLGAPPNPNLAAELYAKGCELAKAGDHERAAHAFERAIQAAPNKAKLYLVLSRSLAHVPGRRRSAEEMLLKAIDLEPGSADLEVEAALFYQKFGKRVAARLHINRALNIMPYHENALKLLRSLDEPKPDERPGRFKKLFET